MAVNGINLGIKDIGTIDEEDQISYRQNTEKHSISHFIVGTYVGAGSKEYGLYGILGWREVAGNSFAF